jgi:competence protein ComEC
MNKNYCITKKYSLIFFITLLFSFFSIGCNLFTTNFSKNIQVDPNKMYVHYIDVGQGDCILVQVNNKNLLIDSGPKSDKRKLFNYLSNLNLEKLDYVIATHPHEDHIGNMDDIIKDYNVLSFYAPKVQSTTKSFENMVEALKSKNLKINVIKNGTHSIDLGKNTRIKVFSPNKNYYENLNNYSPIIKIEYGSTSFLFTGDAEKDVETEVLDNNEDISADVLKIGHHGSSTSTSKDFLKKVNPSIAVISVGKDNIYNHPDEGTINLLNENKIKTYRTDIDGTVLICSDGLKIAKKD